MKKKSILQESFSDLHELGTGQKPKENKNAIPIPMVQQVRPHHSIPAAPRHNIGNLDKIRNKGFQMKKMAEGLANINLSNQADNNMLVPFNELANTGQSNIILHENGLLDNSNVQSVHASAQQKKNSRMKMQPNKKGQNKKK